ncbi:MAG: GNAT family N-acetyltransferase [Clostridia bacterium]|nr:GNAT family N-acetyltransferase [Clostridia bacterium]
MSIITRPYTAADIPAMTAIWNRVVEDGIAFPQTETLTIAEAETFFAGQTACGAAEENGVVLGMYILHPNNIGRCGHIANASYAVAPDARGKGVGESLVRHCLQTAKEEGFRLLQFNAVVATNTAARHLYGKLGFVQLGVIPGGFRMDDRYEDIVVYYHTL